MLFKLLFALFIHNLGQLVLLLIHDGSDLLRIEWPDCFAEHGATTLTKTIVIAEVSPHLYLSILLKVGIEGVVHRAIGGMVTSALVELLATILVAQLPCGVSAQTDGKNLPHPFSF